MKDYSFPKPPFYTLLLGGNRFSLSLLPDGQSWRIEEIALAGEELLLPEEADGLPIKSWLVPPEKTYPELKTLTFSSALREAILHNDAFPSLRELIIPPTSVFLTADGMLLSDGNKDGTHQNYLKTLFGSVDEYYRRSFKEATYPRLLFCLRAGEKKEIRLPSLIRSIAKTAFEGCSVKSILCENPDLVLEEGALTGEEWERDGACLYGESSLLYLLGNTPHLVLAQEVTGLGPHCFSRFVPGQLTAYSLKAIKGRPYPKGAGAIGELSLLDETEPLDYSLLSILTGLKSISFPRGHDLYSSRDGLVYDREGTTLLYCPRGRDLTSLTVPCGTTCIAEGVFTDQRDLRQVSLPPSLRVIKKNAFAGTSLSKVSLPEGIESLEEGSLKGVLFVTVTEGTAHGLFRSLHHRFETMALQNEVWICVRHPKGENSFLYLPRYLTLPGRSAMLSAWEDGPVIDYAAYERARSYATLEEEKNLMALLLLLYGGESYEKKYREVFAPSAWAQAGRLLLEKGPEDLFLLFLKTELLPAEDVEDLLPLCNEKERIDLAAYLLAYRHQRGEEGFSSFHL